MDDEEREQPEQEPITVLAHVEGHAQLVASMSPAAFAQLLREMEASAGELASIEAAEGHVAGPVTVVDLARRRA